MCNSRGVAARQVLQCPSTIGLLPFRHYIYSDSCNNPDLILRPALFDEAPIARCLRKTLNFQTPSSWSKSTNHIRKMARQWRVQKRCP